MTNRLLNWEKITDRRNAPSLQEFTCTTDFPRTPTGRKLPHPRPWEREVQSHFREIRRKLQSGELLLVGRSEDSSIAAAAHLEFTPRSTRTDTFIKAVAVSTNHRGWGGAIADEALAVIFEVARERAASDGAALAIVMGKIHNQNGPSEALVVRAGFEPYPEARGGNYPLWAIQLQLKT